MLNYIEVTAKTEEEAIAKGLAQLGLERDDVSLEILERGRTGFLGIGSVPAKVKLTYEAPDEPEPVRPPEPVPVSPVEEVKPAPAPRPRQQPKPEARPRPAPQSKPAPRAEAQSQTAQSQTVPPQAAAAPERVQAPADDDVAAAIVKFQTGLFEHMGVAATPVVTRDGDTYQVVLEGENMGALIGHRGETLDAIQQLTGYAVNRGRSRRVRVHVDAEGYRARREESLNRLARKTAGKVVKYRRNMTLEAMNAYERHVIHTALQDYPGVTTYSTGTEPNRRTVVAYDPSKT